MLPLLASTALCVDLGAGNATSGSGELTAAFANVSREKKACLGRPLDTADTTGGFTSGSGIVGDDGVRS